VCWGSNSAGQLGDDERETPREKRMVAAGKRDIAAGRVRTLAEVKKRLGA